MAAAIQTFPTTGRVSPRPPASEKERRAKAELVAVRQLVEEMSGKAIAGASRITYALWRAVTDAERPNLPRPETLRLVANWLEATARRFTEHAKRLRRAADAVDRERKSD